VRGFAPNWVFGRVPPFASSAAVSRRCDYEAIVSLFGGPVLQLILYWPLDNQKRLGVHARKRPTIVNPEGFLLEG
jgi:hypothetical protein